MTFYPALVSEVPITITGLTGQIANLFEVKNSLGTVLFSVNNNGDVTYVGDEVISDSLTVNGNIVGNQLLTVAGLATFNGAVVMNSTLNVSGASHFTGDVTANHNLIVNNNLTVNSYEYQNSGIYFAEQVTAPTFVANKGVLYTKDVSGITELFYKDSSNNEIEFTVGGAIGGTSMLNFDYNTSSDLADGTKIYDFLATVDVNQTLATSDGISILYGSANWTAGGNGSALIQGVEGVVRSRSADEALTIRGGYFRTYISANADFAGSTARTSIGCEISARAGYSGGNAVAPEAGTAFVGARIWLAPYFASDYANINNFHGLWIYNEHASQAVTNGIYISSAGGSFTNAFRADLDDSPLSLGASQDIKLLWETADANANAAILVLPEGGATDVPVFIVGDSSLLNKDLGLYDGITEPTFAVVNSSATAAVELNSFSLLFGGNGAMSATDYMIARNSDATNLMNFNVPTGASYEFGVNDVSAFTLSSTTGVFGTIALSGITTLSMNNQLTNTLADGTAPMVITSTTKVSNLNVDRIDDLHASAAISASGALSITANVYALHATGGTAVSISHSTADGYIHLPSGGSTNQILKNSGSAGTGSWGTVTENAGALASITTLGMAGDLTNYEATNDGNPSIFLGASATERFEIQSVYDSGAQTLNYVQFQTYAASATADKGKYVFGVDGTDILSITDSGILMVKSIIGKQGTDIASSSTIVIPKDGNVFELTGTTAVNLITSTGWQDGTEITLIANENVTINHGTVTSGSDITILLAGSSNFAMTANDTLKLVLSSTTAGGQAWREVSRTAI